MAEANENIHFSETKTSDEIKCDNELSEEDRIEVEKVRHEINQKVSDQYRSFESDIRSVYNQRLASMETHMGNNLAEKVTTAQMEILKVNKTFREICRPVGGRWKELFKELTTNLSTEQVNNEITKIDSHTTPLLQPYKSLMTYKELKRDAFKMEELMVALEKLGMPELRKKVEEIMDNDSCEELIKFNSGGLVSADVAARVKKNRMGVEASTIKGGVSNPSSNNQPTSTTNHPTPTTNSSLDPGEALDDRHLLLLSKKMIDCWPKVAVQLGVSQQEMDDLVSSEGVTNYQGAFRMLYGWRESKDDNDHHNNLQSLISALQQIGRPDLIKTLN